MSQWVYGFHAVETLLKQGASLQRVWLPRGRLNARQQKLEALASKAGVSIERVARDAFERFEGVHQHVAAQLSDASQVPHFGEADLPELIEAAESPLLVFLDGVQDPHNLGAILRTADATDVTAVIIPRHQAVGITPVVRKVACGAAETIPVIAVNNLARTMDRVKALGVWLIGLAGETDQLLYQQDLRSPIGLVLGAEGSGLRRLTRQQCDFICALPMEGSVESLNVSVAAGVALYEALRQRKYS